MSKYLDLEGLKYNITKTKEYVKSCTDSLVSYTNNLLKHTSDFSCAQHLIIGADNLTTEKTFKSTNYVYKGENTYLYIGMGDYGGSIDTIKINLNGKILLKDHTYTLSFYAYGGDIVNGYSQDYGFKLQVASNNVSNFTNIVVTTDDINIVAGEWQLVNFTFTPSNDTTSSHNIYLVISDEYKFMGIEGITVTPFMLAESKVPVEWVDNYEGAVEKAIDNVPQMGYPLVTTTATTIVAQPNTYYKNTSAVSTLKIGTAAGKKYYNKNYMKEYFVEFTTGSSGCTLTVPTTIKWLNGEVPALEASKTYQLSIVNNLAIIAKFE